MQAKLTKDGDDPLVYEMTAWNKMGANLTISVKAGSALKPVIGTSYLVEFWDGDETLFSETWSHADYVFQGIVDGTGKPQVSVSQLLMRPVPQEEK